MGVAGHQGIAAGYVVGRFRPNLRSKGDPGSQSRPSYQCEQPFRLWVPEGGQHVAGGVAGGFLRGPDVEMVLAWEAGADR